MDGPNPFYEKVLLLLENGLFGLAFCEKVLLLLENGLYF